jgi:ComF family protein
MIDILLKHIAPHLCCGCGKIGTLLCDNCKYNITSERQQRCLGCAGLADESGVCRHCQVAYSRAWCVGERSGVLQRLIGDFKFQNMYAAHHPLAALLIDSVDQLPSNTVIVPIPTVASHIRERGYDHTYLIANQLARHHHLSLQPILVRATSTKQRGASHAKRISQAKKAFKLAKSIDPSVPYLLIDDVVTTGATIKYAAEILHQAGAIQIWVAVIARQPLD